MLIEITKKEIKEFLFALIFITLPIITISQDSLKTKNKIDKKNQFAIEGQLYPNFNLDIYQPQLKLRVHLNNRFNLRFNSSLQRSLSNKKILQNAGNGLGYVEKIISFYSSTIGFERIFHFDKTLLYTGFEGMVGFGRNNEYGSRTDSISYIADLNYNIIRPVQQFGIRVFSGFDYNLTNQFYLGFELGLVFLKTVHKRGSYQRLDNSSLTDPDITTIIPEESFSDIFVNGIGAVRVGWVFSN